jgi:hypothetical protein
MPYIIVCLGLAVMLGSGTSFLAQTALPGELLWGFKIGINERLQAMFAANEKEYASLDILAIDTRLREAVLLDIRSSLDAPDIKDIKDNIGKHAANIEKEIQVLVARGDYKEANGLATRFQAILAKNVTGSVDTEALLEEASKISDEVSAKLQ